MTEANQAGKTLAEQIADLVKRKPQHYDVVFSVGPENVKVKAVKIILKAASPVFETEFEGNWESAVVKEGDGIPLPEFDPTVFQLFINLIISDTWSLKALKNLNLPANTVLSLLGLCRHYKITKAIKNLEEAVDGIIRNFNDYKDTAEYLEMSLENLETVLSCDLIPLDEKEIFDCVCRWAEEQCQLKKMESTGENFREILGTCFFKIRFPTMKMQDFKRVSLFQKNLFTADETVAIYDFIATDEDEKGQFDKSQLPFTTNPRNSNLFGCSVLCLTRQFKIVENPAYACSGNQQCQRFKVSEKILLHGVGFLGPVDGDTQFEVTVQIQSGVNGRQKRIAVQSRKPYRGIRSYFRS